MKKLTTAKEALARIKDGDVVMVGGFLWGGSPEYVLEQFIDHEARHLTIVNNDMGTPETNMVKVLENRRADKLICTYIAQNAVAQEMIKEDPNCVEFSPQGTLTERIRCGGYGIPAFYTPTGVGTVIAQGKETREFDGKQYLMETALRGNVAIIHAAVVDEFGNCFMKGSAKNYNVLMPAACDYVIVEAEEVVPVGGIDPELVTVSGIFIDAIVVVPKEAK